MKKFLAITLSCLTALSLFACAGNNAPYTSNETAVPQESEQEEYIHSPAVTEFTCDEPIIQDADGIDKCLWEGDKARFEEYYFLARFPKGDKSAVLTVQTEYDLWFENCGEILPVNDEYYWPLEYEYDETKIEIKADPDKENHYTLKILQPCEDETITFIMTEKTWWAGEINRKDLDAHLMRRISITVSTTD